MSLRKAMKKQARIEGMKTIGSQMKRNVGYDVLKPFFLVEHLEDRISATVAQIEYQCEGHYCHIQVIEKLGVYYVWLGPKGRKNMPRVLADEKITRIKGNVPKIRQQSKRR